MKGPGHAPSLLLSAITALAAPTVGARGDGPLPYTLAVEVVAGKDGGPVSLREELARAVRERLATSGCFAHVVGADSAADPASPDLLIELTISGYEDELQFDRALSSLYEQDTPGAGEPSTTVHLGGLVDIRVLTAGERAHVRAKRLERRVVHRAASGGDSREEAAEQWIDVVARGVRVELCGPSAKKWREALDRARASTR